MATHKRKYNGKNNFNNAIDIDYQTKKVKFKPIKGEMTAFSNYSTTASAVRNITGYLCAIYGGFTFLFTMLIGVEIDRYRTAKMLLILIGLWYFSYFATLLLFACNGTLRDNYPKINAKVIHLYNVIIRGENKITKGKVNLDTIENNRLVIEKFDNIYLEYKMTGEVAEYIKRIYIQNKFTDNPFQWRLIFEWKKKPTQGQLHLEYM